MVVDLVAWLGAWKVVTKELIPAAWMAVAKAATKVGWASLMVELMADWLDVEQVVLSVVALVDERVGKKDVE